MEKFIDEPAAPEDMEPEPWDEAATVGYLIDLDETEFMNLLQKVRRLRRQALEIDDV